MLDIKLILANPEAVLENLRRRDPMINLGDIVLLERERILLQNSYDSLQRGLKDGSRVFSGLSSDKMEEKKVALRDLREQSRKVYRDLESVKLRLEDQLLSLPNIILDDVPISQNKDDKNIVRQYGAKPNFDFDFRDHVSIAESLNLIDFKRGAKIAETGFPVYIGKGAVLEWSLINFMINNALENEFSFMLLPLLNNTQSLITTANLPKFSDEIYSLAKDNLHLIPTAETPLTNFYREEVLDSDSLPIRMASFSPCFRREAGAAGKLTRGLMRLHQFNKLETYTICLPESVLDEHQRLISNGESILKKLGLHYRLAKLPSCDLAQQSAQTFDIEIWLPHLGQYSEVSSASNCLDYQARRANIRYKGLDRKGFVSTLNCSALATPRLMIALLESNQTKDGHVIIPEALRKYTGFDKI